jgi:hypothetical protein
MPEKQGSKVVAAVVAIGRVYVYSHAETEIEDFNFYSKF